MAGTGGFMNRSSFMSADVPGRQRAPSSALVGATPLMQIGATPLGGPAGVSRYPSIMPAGGLGMAPGEREGGGGGDEDAFAGGAGAMPLQVRGGLVSPLSLQTLQTSMGMGGAGSTPFRMPLASRTPAELIAGITTAKRLVDASGSRRGSNRHAVTSSILNAVEGSFQVQGRRGRESRGSIGLASHDTFRSHRRPSAASPLTMRSTSTMSHHVERTLHAAFVRTRQKTCGTQTVRRGPYELDQLEVQAIREGREEVIEQLKMMGIVQDPAAQQEPVPSKKELEKKFMKARTMNDVNKRVMHMTGSADDIPEEIGNDPDGVSPDSLGRQVKTLGFFSQLHHAKFMLRKQEEYIKQLSQEKMRLARDKQELIQAIRRDSNTSDSGRPGRRSLAKAAIMDAAVAAVAEREVTVAEPPAPESSDDESDDGKAATGRPDGPCPRCGHDRGQMEAQRGSVLELMPQPRKPTLKEIDDMFLRRRSTRATQGKLSLKSQYERDVNEEKEWQAVLDQAVDLQTYRYKTAALESLEVGVRLKISLEWAEDLMAKAIPLIRTTTPPRVVPAPTPPPAPEQAQSPFALLGTVGTNVAGVAPPDPDKYPVVSKQYTSPALEKAMGRVKGTDGMTRDERDRLICELRLYTLVEEARMLFAMDTRPQCVDPPAAGTPSRTVELLQQLEDVLDASKRRVEEMQQYLGDVFMEFQFSPLIHVKRIKRAGLWWGTHKRHPPPKPRTVDDDGGDEDTHNASMSMSTLSRPPDKAKAEPPALAGNRYAFALTPKDDADAEEGGVRAKKVGDEYGGTERVCFEYAGRVDLGTCHAVFQEFASNFKWLVGQRDERMEKKYNTRWVTEIRRQHDERRREEAAVFKKCEQMRRNFQLGVEPLMKKRISALLRATYAKHRLQTLKGKLNYSTNIAFNLKRGYGRDCLRQYHEAMETSKQLSKASHEYIRDLSNVLVKFYTSTPPEYAPSDHPRADKSQMYANCIYIHDPESWRLLSSQIHRTSLIQGLGIYGCCESIGVTDFVLDVTHRYSKYLREEFVALKKRMRELEDLNTILHKRRDKGGVSQEVGITRQAYARNPDASYIWEESVKGLSADKPNYCSGALGDWGTQKTAKLHTMVGVGQVGTGGVSHEVMSPMLPALPPATLHGPTPPRRQRGGAAAPRPQALNAGFGAAFNEASVGTPAVLDRDAGGVVSPGLSPFGGGTPAGDATAIPLCVLSTPSDVSTAHATPVAPPPGAGSGQVGAASPPAAAKPPPRGLPPIPATDRAALVVEDELQAESKHAREKGQAVRVIVPSALKAVR